MVTLQDKGFGTETPDVSGYVTDGGHPTVGPPNTVDSRSSKKDIVSTKDRDYEGPRKGL